MFLEITNSEVFMLICSYAQNQNYFSGCFAVLVNGAVYI